MGSSVYELKDEEAKIREGIDEGPIVTLVDILLHDAIACRASDIHLEPTSTAMRVRYRIDGILYDRDPLTFGQRFLVLSRLKILASLDIAERRIPQDGKFRVSLQDSAALCSSISIDLRIATFPSAYGEKMVVRILDRSVEHIAFEVLGFSQPIQRSIISFLSRNAGFFLATGPTGCGKSTTLYAMLATLDRASRNVVTMEDPIEYNIEGITQSQVNLKAGFTFENGLRSILRQDPDVVMIGEIRDTPTMQIALQAALTGHLILSTLHTGEAAGAITRLLDMGVEPFLLNATLTGVLAQRLVRRLCIRCKKMRKTSPEEKTALARYGITLDRLFCAAGCDECLNFGYKGRVAVGELLLMTDAMRESITQRVSTAYIQKQAISDGMITMRDDLAKKLSDGIISLEEFYAQLDVY